MTKEFGEKNFKNFFKVYISYKKSLIHSPSKVFSFSKRKKSQQNLSNGINKLDEIKIKSQNILNYRQLKDNRLPFFDFFHWKMQDYSFKI